MKSELSETAKKSGERLLQALLGIDPQQQDMLQTILKEVQKDINLPEPLVTGEILSFFNFDEENYDCF